MYATLCANGSTQIYAVHKTLYANQAGERRKPMGTLEINRWSDEPWRVRVLEGVKYGSVNATIKKLAAEMARAYTEASAALNVEEVMTAIDIDAEINRIESEIAPVGGA